MAVPFIDLRRFEPDFLDRWAEICARLSAETRFVGSPEVAELESAVADRLEVGHAIGCANGTDALQLALRAVGVEPGDTVLLPDATFWATFEAIVNVGGRPVTVDIGLDDLQIDVDLLRRALDEFQPAAAVAVHLYGWGSARLAELRELCRERRVPLIEDGAQAFGTTLDGASIFRGCQLATLSFYPAKVLGACGDAGMVVTDDDDLAGTVRRLGNHGRSSHYGHDLVGWNSRLGGFEAAYLTLSLEYLDERIASRRRATDEYRRRLSTYGVRCLAPPAGQEENGYLNVTLHEAERRAAIETELERRGIGFGNVYPCSISRQPGAASMLAGRIGGRRADYLARGVLNLPVFAHITEEEIEEVIEAMGEAMTVTDKRPRQ